MKIHTAITFAALALAPSVAFAQSTTVDGAANGAATGGAVAGPVGAAVEIPNAVITSVRGSREPSVVVQERVVVGEPLPGTVVLRPVPQYAQYNYAIVNDQRVIVDPRTRRVIRVID